MKFASIIAPWARVHRHRANETIFLYAFDLIELNGDDLRRDPLELPMHGKVG